MQFPKNKPKQHSQENRHRCIQTKHQIVHIDYSIHFLGSVKYYLFFCLKILFKP